MSVPEAFARTQTGVHGEMGAAWLAQLPALLEACAQRWSLTILPPFANLSYNYVAPAVMADGTDVVLKVGVPHPELFGEMDALRLYEGRGMVRLLECEREQGIMLLERLKPGTPLLALDDERATSIAAYLVHRYRRPLPREHSFPTVARWAKGLQRLRSRFDGGTGPFPRRLVATAESLFAELLASSTQPVLLHGDLHHENILAAKREPWLAIDPKGVAGEPAYEVGAWLRNPLPALLQASQPARVLARRVDQFAEGLGFERERLIGWGIAQAVLSAWWTFEDHGYVGADALACAELLETVGG